MPQREDDIRRIVAGARARGLGDEQIRALVQRYDERVQEQPTPQAQPQEPSTPAGGILSTGGAMAGSLIGTLGGYPGRIAGAGLGGALGKGAELFMDDKDDSLIDSVKAMGGAGLKHGAYEVAGGALGRGLKSVGQGLYRVALRPATALQREFPDVIQTGIKEGLAVTRRGAEKASSLVSASAQQADDKIALMQRAGAPPIRPREVLQELRPVAETLRKRADLALPDESGALRSRAMTFARKHRQGIPLTRAQALKREAQDMADAAFRAQDKGAVIKDDVMLANRGMATGLRKAIESRVPGVADINQRTRSLMGVSHALDDATKRNLVFDRLVGAGAGLTGGLAAGGVGGGAAGAAAAAGAVSPALLSHLGIGAARMAPMASHTATPQAIRLAELLAQLASAPEQGQ